MGKKGSSWLSALKRVFTTTPKDKPSAFSTTEPDQRPAREINKKWTSTGRTTRHEAGDTSGRFFPLQRRPSSVEKILGDAERDIQRANFLPPKRPHDAYQHSRHHHHHGQKPQHPEHHNQPHQQKPQRRPPHQLLLPPPLPPPRASVPTSAVAATTPIWPFAQRRFNAAATRIQAAYRGHMARRGYSALRGLVRLQVVMRGQGVRRQTATALRATQTLLRVQGQVRCMRLQMADNRSHQHNRFHDQPQRQLYLTAAPAGDWDGADSSLSKWSAAHVVAADRRQSGWDDSLLPREEIQARVQRKVEAIAKRERALAYHYNHQLFKASPASAYSALAEARNGAAFPIWWGWIDNHHNRQPDTPSITTTPPPATASYYLRPNPPETTTTTQKHHTPAPSRPSSRPATSNQHRRGGAGQPVRDDESLSTFPPTVPSYMAPTVSAKAKVREAPAPAPARTKRRFSFGLTSSLWGGGGGGSSLFAGKGKETPSTAAARPQSVAGRRHRSARSIGEMSIDSTLSLPVGVGRSVFK